MKIIINKCFGAFCIKQEILDKYGNNEDIRTNKEIIELIESGVDCNGCCAKLVVVEIPDEATDYYICNYDGVETVMYVLDGKIHF